MKRPRKEHYEHAIEELDNATIIATHHHAHSNFPDLGDEDAHDDGDFGDFFGFDQSHDKES